MARKPPAGFSDNGLWRARGRKAIGKRELISAKFRVKPDRTKRWFFDVIIFPDRDTLHRFHREQCKESGSPVASGNFAAMTNPWVIYRIPPKGKMEVHPCIGQVLCHLGCITSEVVSHEMTHAAMHYVRAPELYHRRRRPPDFDKMRDEEQLCYAQGRLTSGFWHHWYRLRLRHRRPKKKR